MSSVEFGIITDPTDPTASLECLCHQGQVPGHAEGFYPANEDGFIVSSDEGFAYPWPQTRYVYALCSDCGRLYSDEEIAETGEARVLKTIDYSAPEHKANLVAYLGA